MAIDREGSGLEVINDTLAQMRAGRWDPDNGTPADADSFNASIVFVFQLPDLGFVVDPFTSAQLEFTLNSRGGSPVYAVDLYGLDARTGATVLAADFYFNNADDTRAGVTKLQSSVLATNAVAGRITSTDMAAWLNAQYANGVNAGNYVFLRLAPRGNPAFFDAVNGYLVASADASAPDERPAIRFRYRDAPPVPTHTITATAGNHGRLVPAGAVAVREGGNLTFTLQPDPQFHVNSVTLDGSPLPVANPFSITGITSDATLHVTFAANRVVHDVPAWWMAEAHPGWSSNQIEWALKDFDADGRATWMEYHAGTDPTRADSWFRLDIEQIPASIRVSFDTVPAAPRDRAEGFERIYSLKDTGDLTTGPWSDVPGMTDIIGAGRREEYTLALSGAPDRKFYKGAVQVTNGSTNARPPNIILLLTDDLGWGDLAFRGRPYIKTPNLDRLAREGTFFEQFYVNNPVCSPTRSSFMTSHYPARHRIHHHFGGDPAFNASRDMPDYLNPNVTTVTDVLRANGYATAHFGKWHLGSTPGAPTPDQYGIDDHLTTVSVGPNLRTSDYFDRFNATFARTYFINLSTHAMVHEASRFMEAHQREPFYINIWTMLPHAPLNPTPDQLAVYSGLKVNTNDFSSWMRDYVAAATSRDSKMQVYCASVTALDDAVGKLLDKLDELGLAQDTLIFFTSDNGPEDMTHATNAGMGSPAHLRARKRSLYEGGVRTPCIVRWPGRVPAGAVNSESIISGVDWFPTVVSLAGISMPALSPATDGEDVSDILLGSTRGRTRPLMWEWRSTVTRPEIYQPPPLAMRHGDWKLFVNYNGTGPELYNIAGDEEERVNVAGSNPNRVNTMKTQLLNWKATLP
jgi:N-acetylgalactosamine-6-sulfatase